MDSPKSWQVRSARHKTGLTMQESADLVYSSRGQWLAWERPEDHRDHRKMHPGLAELFALKVGLLKIDDVSPILGRIDSLKKYNVP
jgi:hypothetical protein